MRSKTDVIIFPPLIARRLKHLRLKLRYDGTIGEVPNPSELPQELPGSQELPRNRMSPNLILPAGKICYPVQSSTLVSYMRTLFS